MANYNIKPRITKENAREMQKLGVAKAKENREKRKKMEEELKILLQTTKKKKGKILTPDQIKGLADAENINCTMQTAILVSALKRAEMGDIEAVKFIRDTIGEKPTDKVEIDQSLTVENYAKTHKLKI